jgi:hypothetical protein
MDFTFGIITGGGQIRNLNKIIDSIEKQNIPRYEIIIVGGDKIERKNVFHIPFDESIRRKWITRKKNIITENAKYENIVYMHDYIYLDDDWYEGWLKYGNDFKACMNIIKNLDGTRFRDWTLEFSIHKIMPLNFRFLIPYDMTNLSKWMYFSGAYWVAKKDIMLEMRLNENRLWGQAEDLDWSYRFRDKYEFSMNPYSIVHLMKQHDAVFGYPTEKDLEELKKLK